VTWRLAVAITIAVTSAASTAAQSPAPSDLAERGGQLDTSGFRYQRPVPPGDPGLVVLALDAAALAHSQGPLRRFADVRLVDEHGAQVPYLLERRSERLALDLGLRSVTPQSPALQGASNRSFYAIALPFEDLPGPVVALTTTQPMFRRPVQLGVERPPDRRRREATFETLAHAVWQHSDPATPSPPLELALPVQPARELLLVVDEGDNRPLPIAAVRLLLPGWELRFQRPAGPLRLFYGKDDIAEPRYDIAELAPSTMAGEAREVAAGPESTAETAAAVLSPRAFWAGLAVAVVLLLGVLVRLISSSSTAPPSPPGP
jgi:hypothetical protein